MRSRLALFCLLAAIVFAAAAGGARAQAQQKAVWVPVSGGTGILSLTGFDDSELRELKRERRTDRTDGFAEETWTWTGGALRIIRAPSNVYTAYNRNNESGLLDELGRWQALQLIGLEVDSGNIQRRRNGIGRYFFVISDRNDLNMICLFFRQGLPTRVSGNVEFDDVEAGGEISGFECHLPGTITPAELERRVLPLVEALLLI